MKIGSRALALALVGAALLWLVLAMWCPSLSQAKNMFRSQGADMCSDFGMPRLCAMERNPYQSPQVAAEDRCYPPICYQFVALFPKDQIDGGLLCTMIFAMAFLMTMILLGEKSARPESHGDAWLMAGAMAASAPFILNLERANLIWIPAAGILLFLAWYDVKSMWKRNGALLALAVACAFKLTPAVFALVLVKSRRWRDCLLVAILSTALIVVPFAFCGGMSAIGDWRTCVQTHLEHYGPFKSVGVFVFARIIGVKLFGPDTLGFRTMLVMGRLADVVCGLVSLFTFFRARNRRVEVLMLVLSLLFLPSVTQSYVLLYLAPVLALSVSRRLSMAEGALLFFVLCALRLPVTRGDVRLSLLLADAALFGLLGLGVCRVWWRRETDDD